VIGSRIGVGLASEIVDAILNPPPSVPGLYRTLGAYGSGEGSMSIIGVDDFREDHRLAFDRWLEAQHAETVFESGVVVVGEQPLATKPVLVAVTPADFVFVDEGGAGDGEMPELGRFARSSVKTVDVTDLHDQHVPEPAAESIDEPDALSKVVVGWQAEGGQPDRDEFAFRSAWAAWEAAHRFRRFAQPPLLG